jgi:FkbM family methyltransferase
LKIRWLNGITNYAVFAGAVAARTETALFVVDVPDGFFGRPGRSNPAAWYGQTLARSAYLGDAKPTFEKYKGRNVWKVGRDWKAIEILTFSLSDILVGLDCVDLIDMDIQGAEDEVIAGAIDLLTARVRRLFIETHSQEVEQQIRASLRAGRWRCLRDYPLQTTTQTPFGPINSSGGGLQSWINPQLYYS